MPGADVYVLNMTSQRCERKRPNRDFPHTIQFCPFCFAHRQGAGLVGMSDDVFRADSPTKGVWTHQLIVVVPSSLTQPVLPAAAASKASTSWIWVTGGHNNEIAPIDPKDDELAVAIATAVQTNTVAAMLKHCPNQPVFFKVRTETLPPPPTTAPKPPVGHPPWFAKVA